MKTLRILPVLAILLAITNFSFAQAKTESIPVSGNCEMCKNTIEKAAKKAGASVANWDVEAKTLSVTYNSSSTSAEKIQKSIAAAGYDTRDVRGSDKAYNKLHACCKYERAGNDKMSCCDAEKCGAGENCCAGMDCCKDGKCSVEKKAGQEEHKHADNKQVTGVNCCQNGTCTAKS